jgi:hypothetical protein
VTFCAGSLLLIPLYFVSHPAVGQTAHDFVVHSVMLLIIGIVGTTCRPAPVVPYPSHHEDPSSPAAAMLTGNPVGLHQVVQAGSIRCPLTGRPMPVQPGQFLRRAV